MHLSLFKRVLLNRNKISMLVISIYNNKVQNSFYNNQKYFPPKTSLFYLFFYFCKKYDAYTPLFVPKMIFLLLKSYKDIDFLGQTKSIF